MSESTLDRIVLGTAQLGHPYGRRRHVGALDEPAVRAVLDAAWRLGIRAFDTAEAYGPAARRLESWLASRDLQQQAHVVTKVSPHAADAASIEAACARFAGCASVTLLSHGVLDTPHFSQLREAALRHGAQAGQSVYAADEVRLAAAAGAIRVQAPVNVLDNRQLEAARAARVMLDARSVFLQGVLLDLPEDAERRVAGAGVLVAHVRSAADAAGVRLAPALLASVLLRLAPGDRVVVGIDDVAQLDDITEALLTPRYRLDEFMSLLTPQFGNGLAQPALLDPRTWN